MEEERRIVKEADLLAKKQQREKFLNQHKTVEKDSDEDDKSDLNSDDVKSKTESGKKSDMGS